MKKMLMMACGWMLAVSMAQAVETAGVLSEDGKTLTVDVAENAVAEFDSATLLANVSVVTNVVKTGMGRLDLGDEDDLSDYMGAITVKAGTWRVAASNNVGNVLSTTAEPMYIEPGGAIEFKSSVKTKFRIPRKKFYIGGTGPYGEGAVIYNCTADQGASSFGEYVYLTDDTLVSVTNVAHIYWNNDKYMKVKFQGHDLRIRLIGSNRNFIIGHPQFDDPEGGNLIIDGCGFQFMNGGANVNRYLKPYDGGRVVVTNSGGFQLSSMYCELLWGLDVYSGSLLRAAGNWDHRNTAGDIIFANVTNRNLWYGPIRLHQDSTRVAINKGDKDGSTMNLIGPISGGGLYVYKGSPASAYTPYFHLYCPTNSFTGGLATYLMNLYLWHDGALPAMGGPLMATNSTVMLMDTVHSLPGAIFSGTGSVNNARGIWKGPVTKTETGTLIYNSLVGGGTLDVQQGTFKIEPKTQRAKLAGLVEWDNFYSDPTTARNAAGEGASPILGTNRLEFGASALYNATYRDFWKFGDTPQYAEGLKRRVFCYHGWLWNNSATNETWTFAGVAGTAFRVWVGGKHLWSIGWDGYTIAMATNSLAPGANRFITTVYCSDTGANPRYGNNITNGVWNVPNFGLGYRKGNWIGNVNEADFSPLMDPGDGSLLTYRRPEDAECPLPTTDWVEPYGNAGATFTNICVRYGAALDLGGADYAVDTLSGVPTIQNCPTFTVKGTLSLEATNVAQGRKLATSGALAFAEGAQITLDEPLANIATGAYPLVEATGGVTGAPALPSSAEYRLWRVETTAAGVTLQRLPKGTTIILR